MLTPETAVFLTPPMFGRFRLVARRAIVVDFQCFPFQDAAMVEWKRRLRDCYGEVEGVGRAARSKMDVNYRRISERRMVFLARKYDVSYAVLYRNTPCKFLVVSENKSFKIVSLRSTEE